jgi:hypothetical protein
MRQVAERGCQLDLQSLHFDSPGLSGRGEDETWAAEGDEVVALRNLNFRKFSDVHHQLGAVRSRPRRIRSSSESGELEAVVTDVSVSYTHLRAHET